MMITASQCRSARTLLSWSIGRLANSASVRERDIDDFELERCVPKAATVGAIRRALEARGVVFLPDDGVRVCAVPVGETQDKIAQLRTTRDRTRCLVPGCLN